ncbi:MAG: S8 family peptidase, partial [Rhodococcus sp.]|nr:S8 family peptidase [Rhodococcus sp. (in: high G+C Gram-positive bacteria)]
VRHEDNRTHATVFVPDGKLDHFERLIRAYLAEARDKAGRRRDNQRLIDAIREIRAASLRALWTDSTDVYPTPDDGAVWWEVWLPVRRDRNATVAAFRERAGAQGMEVARGELIFPERTVLMVRTSVEEMQRSIVTLNNIAELRRPKETAEFFDSLERDEQAEWLEDFLGRARFAADGDGPPYACLLDTGINRSHPLLAPALDAADLHTVEPGWGTDDAVGHGTEMAGLALAGDLSNLLADTNPVDIEHRLESVKLIPWDRASGRGPRHHGYLTVEAVARPEVTAPLRRRVFGMAVTARDDRDRGRPSAWSAAIDSLAVDFDGDGDNPRLLVVSAGNVSDSNAWPEYPDSNDTDGVHDPAQAWNALTVGACTDLVQITEPDTGDFSPIAPEGGLSPFSTTSVTWDRYWPLKPDVVFEGGNAAKDRLSAVSLSSLRLLTTHHVPTNRLFTTTNATSAATALASRFAAQIMAIYPGLRPETVRALIVHSAEWTDAMKVQFLPVGRTPSKADYLRLVQRCGFGVPDIARARWSVENSLTMVVEERLHPFRRTGSNPPTLRDMHLHGLPWPRDVLEGLGATPVEMRVTLSYFIEPNPSRRGHRSRYRYESHGLHFEVKRPLESILEFRKRINLAARDEDEGTRRRTDGDPAWLIGTRGRHRGSLHSDIWRGTAADLASRGVIAVYPTTGWWKTRPALERYDKAARYTMVVSIRAPEVDVDLYTEVESLIAVRVDAGL